MNNKSEKIDIEIRENYKWTYIISSNEGIF